MQTPICDALHFGAVPPTTSRAASEPAMPKRPRLHLLKTRGLIVCNCVNDNSVIGTPLVSDNCTISPTMWCAGWNGSPFFSFRQSAMSVAIRPGSNCAAMRSGWQLERVDRHLSSPATRRQRVNALKTPSLSSCKFCKSMANLSTLSSNQ